MLRPHNRDYCCRSLVCGVLQEKQAAEAAQQAGPSAAFDAADEARLQEQLQELSSKIAQLDEGEQQQSAVSLTSCAARRERREAAGGCLCQGRKAGNSNKAVACLGLRQ
jgi:hypothetical protein